MSHYTKESTYEINRNDKLRVAGILGEVILSEQNYKEVVSLVNGEVFNSIIADNERQNTNNFYLLYEYFIRNNQEEIIQKYFDFDFQSSIDNDFTLLEINSNQDSFAGMLKSVAFKKELSSQLVVLNSHTENNKNEYRETTQGTANQTNFNVCFSKIKEEIPNNSVSVAIINHNKKESNIATILNNIHESDILINNNQYHEKGVIVLTASRQDVVESINAITNLVSVKIVFKADSFSENDRHQENVVIIGEINHKNLSDFQIKTISNHSKKLIENVVYNDIGFSTVNYSQIKPPPVSLVKFAKLKDDLEQINHKTNNLSNQNNSNWKWLKEITNYKKSKNEKIIKPTDLTSGEVANLVASGVIDGKVLEGNGSHIVAGGVQHREREVITQEKDKSGETVYSKQTLLYSQPYLNVLVNDGKKTYIKELGEEMEG